MTLSFPPMLRNALILALVASAFLAGAGTVLSQAPASAPATTSAKAYTSVEVSDPDVQAAVKVAIADQRQHNHSDVKLLSIVSAERQPVSARNLRLCLSMDRSGNTQLARVVLSRNAKKQWSVTIWSWGSCGR